MDTHFTQLLSGVVRRRARCHLRQWTPLDAPHPARQPQASGRALRPFRCRNLGFFLCRGGAFCVASARRIARQPEREGLSDGIRACVHACVRACARARVYHLTAQSHAFPHACAHTHVHMHAHAHKHTRTHVHTRTRTHTHTHIFSLLPSFCTPLPLARARSLIQA